MLASLHISLKLAIALAGIGIVLGVHYLLAPYPKAHLLLAFLVVHGVVCLWAAGRAFAISFGPLRGCGVGIAAWLWFAFESWALLFMWATSTGARH
jgi:hypothetical protein